MTELKRSRKWWSTRKWLAVAAIAVLLGFVGYRAFHCVIESISGAYCQWWVADMVIEYMESHDGSWPRDWEDLKEPYEICAGRSGTVWRFEELRGRVSIDFSVAPTKLSSVETGSGVAPLRVIYLRNGKRVHWVGNEPNSMILQYLRERAQRPASYQAPHPPDPTERTSRQALLELGARFKVDGEGHVTSVNTRPEFSDPAMKHIEPLKKLRELQLNYSKITDDGLGQVKGLIKLEVLGLSQTRVTDAGLKYLRYLPALRVLNLNGTRVTDAGLVHLYELKNLRQILLEDTQVTAEGVLRFRKTSPNCEIYHEQGMGKGTGVVFGLRITMKNCGLDSFPHRAGLEWSGSGVRERVRGQSLNSE